MVDWKCCIMVFNIMKQCRCFNNNEEWMNETARNNKVKTTLERNVIINVLTVEQKLKEMQRWRFFFYLDFAVASSQNNLHTKLCSIWRHNLVLMVIRLLRALCRWTIKISWGSGGGHRSYICSIPKTLSWMEFGVHCPFNLSDTRSHYLI